LTTHFVEANENLSPYKIGQSHRHTAEITQGIDTWSETKLDVIFSPHLVPISRGMLSTVYLTLNEDLAAGEAQTLFNETYDKMPLVRILPPGELATFAHTQRTNSAAISVTQVTPRQLIVCSSIDNLGKGAAGQAVQNFNLMFGWDETMGLL
jgi:N-acetyl-gamma-glutamyl-phosphate reductase